MIYLERPPAAGLAQNVRALWYSCARGKSFSRQRVLPNGCVQIVINLAADHLIDCDGARDAPMAGAVVSGARSACAMIATTNLAELVGVVFQPGGFAAFCRGPVDSFSHRHVPLKAAWPCVDALRDKLRTQATPASALDLLEAALGRFQRPDTPHDRVVRYAVGAFARARPASVAQTAENIGWSSRHFSNVFREHVGIRPATWCRVQRFQRIVRRLHAGAGVSLAELALDCGYCDQSHFARDFRVFSGLDATSYLASQRPWANHVDVG